MRAAHVFSNSCDCAACAEDRLAAAVGGRPLTLLDLLIGAVGAGLTTVWASAILGLACALFAR